MEAIGMYLLKSAIWLSGFALVYFLVLRNEHFFRLNRVYLLAGIIASLLFPFYTFHYAVILPAISTSTDIGELSAGMVVPEQASPLTIYFWIYLLGSLIFLFRLLFQTWKIIRKLQTAGYERAGAMKLVRTPEFVSSFSFFSFVFVNPSIATQEMEEIMNHEREHIQQRHWFDLLLVELICIVQWFNPFAWIYAHLIRQNHEFLADESALQRTADPAVYQAALLNQLLGVPVFSLTNSFSYSLNKKRFKMMKKKIDSPFRKLKMLLVLPFVAMLFYAFAVPEYQYGSDNNSVEPQEKTTDVQGQVVKADGTTPLQGTSVIVRNSTTGTLTDKDGNFLLKDIPANSELVFTFVGFKSKVQKVDGQPMKIVMEGSKVGLEQVTVVAYGTPPPPPPPPPASFRGFDEANPPLIYLDGILITKAAMDKVNPETFESISVIKDKSATAVYGEKGKNGVILIKTKGKDWKKEVVVEGSGTPPPPPQSVSGKGIDDANPPLIYLDGKAISKSEMDQLGPDKIETIDILKGKSAIDRYGEKARNGVILLSSKGHQGNIVWKSGDTYSHGQRLSNKDSEIVLQKAYDVDAVNPPIYIVDGVLTNPKTAALPKPDQIKTTVIMKEEAAVALYGENGKNGAVQITTKAKQEAVMVTKVNGPGLDGVFTVVEEMPEFPGGEKALRDFIGSTVRYPYYAVKENIQGKVFVTFVVKSDGTVGNAKVVRGVHPLLDEEALRVVNLLPTWKPGKQGGKEVNVAYTIPVQFALDGNKDAKQALPFPAPKVGSQRADGVFIVVEEMPEFPGGEMALRKFIAETVKYPVDAIKEGIQGKVFVTFVVKSDGTVADAKIARGVHPLLDNEAIRVVNLLPKWKPGKQGGKEVSVSYTIPVQFALDGAKSEYKTVPDPAAGPQKGEKVVFVVVEEMPEFPGGANELSQFIAKSVKYPAEAIKDKTQGKVLVSFVVSSSGKIEQAKIQRSVSPALDAEAIRVVNLMPDWKPGKQRGQAVSVEYTIPIEFKLM
ncbi:MAG: TonB family protein [Prolixibacteraceae bacterium]